MSPKNLNSGKSIPYRYVFFTMLLASVVFILQEYVSYSYSRADYDFGWFFIATNTLCGYLLWTAFCPLIFRLSRAFTLGRRITPGKVAGHVGLSVVLAFAHRVLSSLMLFCVYFVKEGRWIGGVNDHTLGSIFINVFSSFIIYWIFVGVFLAADYYRRFQQKQLELVRMENELNNAQLRALKMQLHPHFLFNTLHTIASLMDENVERAQKMVSQIGYLLRSILEQDQKHTISLKDELKYIRSYLDIEQTRFRDRLQVEYDIPNDTLKARVPNLILQPLVENAIKHGFSKRTDCGKIKVTSRRSNGRLELVVGDDGHGVKDPGQVLDHGGIGLKNVQKRLAQLYPDNFEFRFDSQGKTGFVATIVMPYEAEKS